MASQAEYEWSCEALTADAQAATAEEWLRAIWEGAPAPLRWFLRFGWRIGLGLRLGPADSAHILGWRIDENSAARVSVDARSRIMNANNTLTSVDHVIRWETEVRYESFLGRLAWAPARLLHERIVPWSVRRAIRLGTTGASRRAHRDQGPGHER